MKLLYPALLLLSMLPALPAQDANAPFPPGEVPAVVSQEVRLTPAELKELAGPIALYPDPLVALILPASTFPADVVLAARFAQSNEDPAAVEDKPWDDSIKGLTRYPDVVAWMDQNLEWTTQLGYAYLAQPDDVMDAIQDLRNQAAAVGNLADTPQQRIVREETYIRIVPADPEYIYVPIYDPQVVYVERPVERPFLTFGTPWLVGSWLSYDFDWHRHRLYCGEWRGGWDYHRHDRDRPERRDHRGENVFINNNITNFQVWQGDSRRRLASTRAFAETRNRIEQRTVVKPKVFVERNDSPRRPMAVGDRRTDGHRDGQTPRDGREQAGRTVGPDGRMNDRGKDGDGRDRDRDGRDNLPGERDRDRNPVANGDNEKMGDKDREGPRGPQHDRPGEHGKGRVAVPGSAAPTVTGEGRQENRPDRDRGNPTASDKSRDPGKGRGSDQPREQNRPDMNGKPGSDRDQRPDGRNGVPKVGNPPSIPGSSAPGQDRDGRPDKNQSGPKAERPDMRGGQDGRSPSQNGKPQEENRGTSTKPRPEPGRGDGRSPKVDDGNRIPRAVPPTPAPQAARPSPAKPAAPSVSPSPSERKGPSNPRPNVNPPQAVRPGPAPSQAQRPSAPQPQARPESDKRREAPRPQASAATAPKPSAPRPQPQAKPQPKPQPAVAARPSPPKPAPTAAAATPPKSPGKKPAKTDKDDKKNR